MTQLGREIGSGESQAFCRKVTRWLCQHKKKCVRSFDSESSTDKGTGIASSSAWQIVIDRGFVDAVGNGGQAPRHGCAECHSGRSPEDTHPGEECAPGLRSHLQQLTCAGRVCSRLFVTASSRIREIGTSEFPLVGHWPNEVIRRIHPLGGCICQVTGGASRCIVT